MGRCHDFGVQVRADCEHPMQAGEDSCACPECDSVCEGRFKGCVAVWARGPRPVEVASSPVLPGHPAANGAGGSAPVPPTDPAFAFERPEEQPPRLGGGEASLHLVGWADASTVRGEVDALSRGVSHQQALVSQLIDAYSDLRGSVKDERLAAIVRSTVEELLGCHQASIETEMARGTRRLDQVAADLDELRREHRNERSMTAARHDELGSELRNLLARARADLSDMLSAGTRRLDEVVSQIAELTTAQHAVAGNTTKAHEDLRTALDDALRRNAAEASEALAANAGKLDEAACDIKELLAGVSSSTAEVREAKEGAERLFSDLREAMLHQHDVARSDRDLTRHLMVEKIDAFATSIEESAKDALVRAVAASEERTTERVERAVAELRRSLQDAEEASERHLAEVARAEDERSRALEASLSQLREALQGTHALAAAQQEETELLDRAMRVLQQSIAEQHAGLLEALGRHRRSSSDLLRRQLRPLVEAIVDDAARRDEQATLRRIETAVTNVRRSLQEAGPPDTSSKNPRPRRGAR